MNSEDKRFANLDFYCENSIRGSDCFGESYCRDYYTKKKRCTHKNWECPGCKVMVCGCCAFCDSICPRCRKSVEDYEYEALKECKWCGSKCREDSTDYMAYGLQYATCQKCQAIHCWDCFRMNVKGKFASYNIDHGTIQYACPECVSNINV